MSDLYDTIRMGQIASIKGRPAVYLYYASYSGGSGPLWAIEGLAVQFTTRESWGYRPATCRKVSATAIELELENGRVEVIPLREIGRYDQGHLAGNQQFNFDESDIVLMSTNDAEWGND